MDISFIIPFFNGGKYIEECLASIYSQDIPEEYFEVILVNDCSTDKSSIHLIHKAQETHNNILIIDNPRNYRCGKSRNVGLSAAKGQYIWFVDQDDMIAPKCLEKLIHISRQSQLDMLVFDYSNYDGFKKTIVKKDLVKNDSEEISGLEYISTICGGDFWHSEYDTNVWHSLFRRDFLLSNKIFSPEISYCEDLLVSLHSIICAKKIRTISCSYYYYRYNPESVFHTEVGYNGRTLYDATLFAGSEILKISKVVPDQESDMKSTVCSGGITRINSFTKSLIKIESNEIRSFYDQVSSRPEVIRQAMPVLNSKNRWLLSHPSSVIFLHNLYVVYKKIKI